MVTTSMRRVLQTKQHVRPDTSPTPLDSVTAIRVPGVPTPHPPAPPRAWHVPMESSPTLLEIPFALRALLVVFPRGIGALSIQFPPCSTMLAIHALPADTNRVRVAYKQIQDSTPMFPGRLKRISAMPDIIRKTSDKWHASFAQSEKSHPPQATPVVMRSAPRVARTN